MYNILVVDDDRLIGEMLKLMLEHEGYCVWVIQNPERTVENILNKKIDLVLLDQFISGISGIAICKEIRHKKNVCDIPVIMLSAEPKVRKKCLEAGATSFISKPFEREVLLSKIKIVLEKAQE